MAMDGNEFLRDSTSSSPRVIIRANSSNNPQWDCNGSDQFIKSATAWNNRGPFIALNLEAPASTAFKTGDVLIRNPCSGHQSTSPLLSHQHQTVPFNNITQAVDFETPVFKGKVLVMLRGLPDTPSLFNGKKRLMWMAVQGQFKKAVGLDSLMLGSEFERPLKVPAGGLLSKASMWLIKSMGAGVQLNTAGSNPHILAPLIAAAQVVNVSRPGQEPSLLDAEEDMTLFDPSLTSSWSSKAMSASKRRAHFGSKANRQSCAFDTDNIWTFHVYDHVMDYATFLLPIPFFKVDLVQVLDGQPMQLLLKDMESNSPMLKLEVWHKRMLEHKSNTISNSETTTTAVPSTRSSYECGKASCMSGALSRTGSLKAGLIKA